MTITLFLRSSARTRAISRSLVVFPTPGRPRIRRFWPVSISPRSISMVPNTARPTRRVRPTTSPLRFLMAEIRCRVRSMPARLSPLNSPIRATTWASSSRLTGFSASRSTRSGKRASGALPRSITTSISSSSGSLRSAVWRLSGRVATSRWMSSMGESPFVWFFIAILSGHQSRWSRGWRRRSSLVQSDRPAWGPMVSSAMIASGSLKVIRPGVPARSNASRR